jgi:hypothetical protein
MSYTRKLFAIAALAVVGLASTAMHAKAQAVWIGDLGNFHLIGCYYTGVGCI